MESEFIKKENSKATVLFVHGILGSPKRFEELYPLVPESFSIVKLVLEGHGKKAKDFRKSNIKKWKNHLRNTIISLKNDNQKVILVGHSMGTLLGIKEEIDGVSPDALFLLNVPLKPHMTWKMMKSCINIVYKKEENLNRQEKLLKDNCSITLTKNPFAYLLWIPRYLELFKEMRKTRPLISKIRHICICFHSKKDELVSQKTYKYLQEAKNIKTYYLENSTHYSNEGEDLVLIKNEFTKLMKSFEEEKKDPFQSDFLKELRKVIKPKEIK